MKLFSIFKQNQDVKPEDLPWNNQPSIFSHIQVNLESSGRLAASAHPLPDDERRYKNGSLRWAPGAMDGAFGHHGSPEKMEKEAEGIADLIKSISKKNGLVEKIALYKILSEDNIMDFIDPAFEKIVAAEVPVYPHLHNYARWLAFESPDRGAVKFGIALLGLIRDSSDHDKIIILGKHEEFTLFSAVAITNSLENAEQALWELAKCVDGWGRIHLVERLANTNDRSIKRWLVREGYKNTVMYEYLAYTCAVSGELKMELSAPEITEDVLSAAGDIIVALINGGPAETMDSYEESAEVTRLYLTHLENKADTLDVFLKLATIKNFLEDNDVDWAERERKGWSMNLRSDLLIDLHRILSDAKWKQMVLEKQHTTDTVEFWHVTQAAPILGISLWGTHWERLVKDPLHSSHWYEVMKNADQERISQIVALAMEKLPLNEIATGPADEMGLGPEYNSHACLDYLLQDLGDYPGQGFELVKTGLASSVTRNRNMAIRTLSGWRAENWPKGTIELLMQAKEHEPNKDTRKNFNNLLAGKELE
jgi:hypothetical protein